MTRSVVALIILLHIDQSQLVHICGNYCGPHWCAGMDISESDCDDLMPPERWSLTGYSCADACCRQHDICCGHQVNTTACNRIIVKCLHDCNPFSLTCTRDGVPVPASTIEIGMEIVEDWCCGAPCSPKNLFVPAL